MTRPGADNRGPLLNIGSWFTIVAMLLFSSVKIYTKWSVMGKLQYDDLFVIVAAVCYILCVKRKNALQVV